MPISSIRINIFFLIFQLEVRKVSGHPKISGDEALVVITGSATLLCWVGKISYLQIMRYVDFTEGFEFFSKNIVSLYKFIFAGYSYMVFVPPPSRNPKEIRKN